jgi:hypothetical protein
MNDNYVDRFVLDLIPLPDVPLEGIREFVPALFHGHQDVAAMVRFM